MKRAALSEASESIAPPRCAGLLAITPNGRPSTRISEVTMPMPNLGRSSSTVPASASVSITSRTAYTRSRFSGMIAPHPALIGRVPLAQRALEVGEVPLGDRDRLGLVGDRDVDHAVRHLDRHRPDVLGREHAEPAALDHRRAAHADRRVGGGDDHVAAAEQRRVAGEAAARGDADHRHQRRELREARERALAGADAVGVARAPAAALGEQHERHAAALGDVDQAIGLAVVLLALRSRQHGVVVGHHRAARGGIVEQRAVHRADAGDHAVGGRLVDQVLERAPAPLRRDHQPAVLDEGAGVAEVEHVLARGALLRGAPSRDRFRPRRVGGLGAPAQHLVEVRAHAIEIDLVPGRVVVLGDLAFLDEEERVAFVERVALGDRDAAHHAAHGRRDLVLHLHRFHDHDRRAAPHRVALADQDADDGALERRPHRDRPRRRARRLPLGRPIELAAAAARP